MCPELSILAVSTVVSNSVTRFFIDSASAVRSYTFLFLEHSDPWLVYPNTVGWMMVCGDLGNIRSVEFFVFDLLP